MHVNKHPLGPIMNLDESRKSSLHSVLLCLSICTSFVYSGGSGHNGGQGSGHLDGSSGHPGGGGQTGGQPCGHFDMSSGHPEGGGQLGGQPCGHFVMSSGHPGGGGQYGGHFWQFGHGSTLIIRLGPLPDAGFAASFTIIPCASTPESA